jgi:hypothetical protein
MLTTILFTIFGTLLLLFGCLSGLFLLRYSVGLLDADIDEEILRWLTSGGIFIGTILILLGYYLP